MANFQGVSDGWPEATPEQNARLKALCKDMKSLKAYRIAFEFLEQNPQATHSEIVETLVINKPEYIASTLARTMAEKIAHSVLDIKSKE